MTKTNETTKSTDISTDWIKETWTEGSDQIRPLEDYTLLKVYNPMMGSKPDIDKDWFIVELTDDWWIPLDKELKNVQVLELVKCYKW